MNRTTCMIVFAGQMWRKIVAADSSCCLRQKPPYDARIPIIRRGGQPEELA